MPISNPAPFAAFWSRLPIQSIGWALGSASVSSRTEGGELITAERGVRLWRADVGLHSMLHREGEAILARLNVMAGADRSFFAYPRPIEGPEVDPAGAIIGGYSPAIGQIASDRIQLSLTGLAPGYILAVGDFLSFAYGSAPERYALHQIVDDGVVASGTGATGLFEVRPAIRPGAAVGAAVRLYRPMIRAQLVRDSIQPGVSSGLRRSGISFSIMQTLRG